MTCVGGAPNAFYYPQFYAAQPFEKCGIEISDCLCTDELTFTQDGDNNLTFQLNNYYGFIIFWFVFRRSL